MRSCIAAIAALGAGFPFAAFAQTQSVSQPFPVSATVIAGCVIAVDGGGRWGRIDFGTVAGTTQGSVDASLVSAAGAGIAVECTPGVTASMTADTGSHALSGGRRMASVSAGTVPIPYALFVNGSTTPWLAQSVPLSFTSTTGRWTIPILGRATLTRPMAAGLYTDTVRVTITW